MTNEEAIKILAMVGCMNGTEIEEACALAISALQKQIPMRPIHNNINGMDICPNCGRNVYHAHAWCTRWVSENYKGCGQRLNWRDEE